MCGLVAQIGRGPVDRRRLEAMSADLTHRGPDDSGIYVNGSLGLGHRRLSILDLSDAGHQPMFSASGRFVIVYNGELYNYQEIRLDLEAGGTRFKSQGDTEVILEAYARWGADCLDRFRGMFAFVIADLEQRTAFIARDHLGIKPLFFCQGAFGFLAASEIKVFRHFIDLELNEAAIGEQFLYRYVAGRNTIYRNIFRLDAGCFMTVDGAGNYRETRYYDVTASLAARQRKAPDIEQTAAALEEAVERHTLSDVGYNVQLSGGLDSSFIVALLARKLGQTPNTFSITLAEPAEDEGAYQRFVAESFGAEHQSFQFGGTDLAESYLRATWHMDMPIIHTACPLLMLLCDRSSSHSKVILTGEGADELFGGYMRYRVNRVRGFAFRIRKLGVSASLVPSVGKLSNLRALLSRDLALDSQVLADPNRVQDCFDIALTGAGTRETASAGFDSLLEKMIAIDQTAYLTSMLERQDRMSMAASVESRVPFCDHKIFDLVNSWAPEQKVKNGHPKSALKTIAETYFPRDFAYRRKNGFVLPVDKWLRDSAGFGRYLDLLRDSRFRERGFYNVETVGRLIRDHLSGTANHGKFLIRLINFEVWHRMFIDKSLAPDAGHGE